MFTIPDLSGIFPICPFPIKAPTGNIPERVRHTSRRTFPEKNVRDSSHCKPSKWHFPAERPLAFPPWGLLNFSRNPVDLRSDTTCTLLHPRNGEKYRRTFPTSIPMRVPRIGRWIHRRWVCDRGTPDFAPNHSETLQNKSFGHRPLNGPF